jgi:hypothetical protein
VPRLAPLALPHLEASSVGAADRGRASDRGLRRSFARKAALSDGYNIDDDFAPASTASGTTDPEGDMAAEDLEIHKEKLSAGYEKNRMVGVFKNGGSDFSEEQRVACRFSYPHDDKVIMPETGLPQNGVLRRDVQT